MHQAGRLRPSRAGRDVILLHGAKITTRERKPVESDVLDRVGDSGITFHRAIIDAYEFGQSWDVDVGSAAAWLQGNFAIERRSFTGSVNPLKSVHHPSPWRPLSGISSQVVKPRHGCIDSVPGVVV